MLFFFWRSFKFLLPKWLTCEVSQLVQPSWNDNTIRVSRTFSTTTTTTTITTTTIKTIKNNLIPLITFRKDPSTLIQLVSLLYFKKQITRISQAFVSYATCQPPPLRRQIRLMWWWIRWRRRLPLRMRLRLRLRILTCLLRLFNMLLMLFIILLDWIGKKIVSEHLNYTRNCVE